MAALAIIIGAGPGVGAALAGRLARDGYDVGLVARTEATLAAIGEPLQQQGSTVGWATADAGDAEALTAAISRLTAHSSPLAVLHHNAVAPRQGPLLEAGPDGLLADLAVGAASLVTAVRAARAHLVRGSVVLATGGGAADSPYPPMGTLGVQKAALRTAVTTLDADLRADGIRCASLTVRGVIAPGTAFDPALIADVLADLVPGAAEAGDAWRTELVFPA